MSEIPDGTTLKQRMQDDPTLKKVLDQQIDVMRGCMMALVASLESSGQRNSSAVQIILSAMATTTRLFVNGYPSRAAQIEILQGMASYFAAETEYVKLVAAQEAANAEKETTSG